MQNLSDCSYFDLSLNLALAKLTLQTSDYQNLNGIEYSSLAVRL